MISLYVLLTTPIPVPWTLLIRGAVVVMAYTAATRFIPNVGINPVNIAVLAGFLSGIFRNLKSAVHRQSTDMADSLMVAGAILALVLSVSAVILYIPATLLPYVLSAGIATLGAVYGALLLWDRPTLDHIGWPVERWGVKGQINAIHWVILRCVGLATATAYAATYWTLTEWIVAHAALPVIFYALYTWSIIATHPLDDDK